MRWILKLEGFLTIENVEAKEETKEKDAEKNSAKVKIIKKKETKGKSIC